MLLRKVPVAMLIMVSSNLATAQIDKARGEYFQKFDEQFRRTMEGNNGEVYWNNYKEMTSRFNDLVLKACEVLNTLKQTGPEKLTDQLQRFCSDSVSRFREKNNRVYAKVEKRGESYSSEMSDLRSEFNDFKKALDDVLTAFVLTARAIKTSEENLNQARDIWGGKLKDAYQATTQQIENGKMKSARASAAQLRDAARDVQKYVFLGKKPLDDLDARKIRSVLDPLEGRIGKITVNSSQLTEESDDWKSQYRDLQDGWKEVTSLFNDAFKQFVEWAKMFNSMCESCRS